MAAIALMVLAGLLAGGQAWVNRPQGRAAALLNELRRHEDATPTFYERVRKAIGLPLPPQREVYEIPPALADLGPAVVPILVDAMKDPSPVARGGAAQALGMIGDARAVPAIVAVLANDKETYVRLEAVGALGNFDEPVAIEALIRALNQDADARVRAEAARSLGGIGNPATGAALAHALAGDAEGQVRNLAAEALGKVGDTNAVPALIATLNDPYEDARVLAAFALADLRDRRAVPALMAATKGGADRVRSAALWALGSLGDRQAVPAILKAADDNSPDVRENALITLGRIGGPEALPRLASALRSTNARDRRGAARGLGRLGGPEVVPLLLAALTDTDSSVRWTAAEELAYVGDARAVAGLVVATKDEQDFIQWSAVLGLDAIRASEADEAAATMLRNWIASNDRTGFTFGILGSPEVVPALRHNLCDKSDDMTFPAAIALARVGTPEARQALQEGARSAKSRFMRQLVGGILKDGLAPALTAELLDRRPSRRPYKNEIVHVFLYLNDPAALPALEEVRKTGDSVLREEAARVIKHLRRIAPPPAQGP
jgi:HEAT repeat protein